MKAASQPETPRRKTGMPLFAGAALLSAALATSWLMSSCGGVARAESLLPSLNLDLRETTVSGISSGAFMATQMAVVHSSHIRGVAVTAGGPYFCAGANSWGGAEIAETLARCMQGDPMYPAKEITEDDQQLMRETTRRWAKEGLIDPLDQLARQKVWIFHGYNDGIVKRPVSDALETYYRAFVPPHRIFHKRELPAAHAQISVVCASGKDKTGAACNTCDATGGNFINTCSVDKTPYDAAGMALRFFYGPMQRAASTQLKGSLLSFDQGGYTLMDGETIRPDKISMADKGYLYVPQSCLNGEACRLHIAFHGCQQNAGKIGMDFVKGAGYNEWAEQNHLVVLFPQAASSMLLPMNPNACWDWWGYNDTGDRKTGHFATREGFQIAAVWRMAEALAGSDSLTDDAERAAPATHAAAPGTRLEAPVAEVLETSSTQTLLTWKATPGAAAYRVYRSTSGVAPKDGGKSDFLLVSPKNLSDTAYVDGDLTEKTHYQYRVAALDEAGREVASSPLAAETLKSPPACDPYFSMLAGRPVDRHGLPTKVTCK